MAEPVPAGMLPDVRTHLVNELSRELAAGGGAIVQTFALACMAGSQIAIADPRVSDPYDQARLLAAGERRRLAHASLTWVSPNMTALTLAAAPAMPPFRPAPADLPSPHGLIYFAAPLAEADEVPAVDLAVMDDGSVHRFPCGRFQICAASWGPWDHGGLWRGGGTWFTFYTLDPESPSRLRLDNECVIGARRDTPGEEDEDELLAQIRDSAGTASWMHLVLAAIRLMATSNTARVAEQAPVRPVRRRAGRAGVQRPAEPVRLLDVTSRPRAEREPVDDHEGRGRTYRVRWIVEGHWRRQWYPASRTHRPRYIDSYVKGPQEAPLRVKETVHLWRDPTEPPNARTGASR